jgi:uncharacterized protein (TIGR02996 family)
MTDERAFLAAILEQPDDDARKLIYADWLEERGDPRGEYLRLMMKVRQERVRASAEQRQRYTGLSEELAGLRNQGRRTMRAGSSQDNPPRQARIRELESQLAELAKQVGRKEVPARLQELAARLDPNWLAAVSDPEIERCANTAGESWWLRFDFVCEKTWADLKPTEDKSVRHCETCSKNVYFCDNLADAREHSQENHCIAVDLGVIRREDDLRPRTMFLGQPSKEDVRGTYEEDVDPVSQARLDVRNDGRTKLKRQR